MINPIFKGDIIYTPTKDKFSIYEDSYLVVVGGKVKGIYRELDNFYKDYEIKDFTGKMIIPGFIDLHLHAPQYPNRGLGLDKELIPWLNTYTFPEESRYHNLDYSEKVFKKFINELWSVGTTRSVVFSTIFKESTKILLDMFIKSGLGAFVGKVNMDMNTPQSLKEDTDESLNDTEEILIEYMSKSNLVKPIITPRFIPTCSKELLGSLGKLAKKYNVPVQSHLNENTGEVIWVKELFPDSKNYASIYDDFELFGQTPTIMAHCIFNNEDEIKLMAENQVFIAHCPYSNFNLSSGIMPARKYLDAGIPIGLASDISGGHSLSIPQIMVAAIEGSKIVWLRSDKKLAPLTISEAFYLGTKGGGKFFGNVGSFEEGYDFDALVIDDSSLECGKNLSTLERLQRYIYIGDDRNIIARYVQGKEVDRPF